MKFRFLAVVALVFVAFAYFLKNNEESDAYRKTERQSVQPKTAEKMSKEQYNQPKIKENKEIKESITIVRKKFIQIRKPIQIVVTLKDSTPREEQVEWAPLTKTAESLPTPKSEWVVQKIQSSERGCRPDDNCIPVGKNGVLLVGTSVLAEQQQTPWRGIVEVGQYEFKTPLVHIR